MVNSVILLLKTVNNVLQGKLLTAVEMDVLSMLSITSLKLMTVKMLKAQRKPKPKSLSLSLSLSLPLKQSNSPEFVKKIL